MDMLKSLETGSLWKHYNGNIYKIVAITNLPNEARYPTTVVYQNVFNDTMWSRPLSDWSRSFTKVP